MKLMRLIPVLFAAAMLSLGACEQKPTAANDEAAIRAQNAKWLDAIAKKDADAVAALYAQDGEFMPPNASKVTGRDAIKGAWQQMFQIPGVGLTFTTDKLVVSQSADMAVDIGSYDFKSESGGSSATDKGKSVVTWVKKDGTWLVMTDMFSSDAPALNHRAVRGDGANPPQDRGAISRASPSIFQLRVSTLWSAECPLGRDY